MSKYLGLAVAAATSLFAAQASAALVTQTFFSGTPAPSTTGPAVSQAFPFTNTFNVARFDSSLGTLNSVTITVTGNVSISAQVTNIGATTANFTDAEATVPVRITLPSQGNATIFNSVSTSGTSGAGSVGSLQTVVAITGNTAVNSGAIALSDTSPFVGGAGTTVQLQAIGGSVTASGVGVPGVTFFGGIGSAALTVQVAYDFTAAVVPPPTGVPEPASLALLGLGLAAVGVIRRRV